jgi:O-antigen/teichoic acid export membrane protein
MFPKVSEMRALGQSPIALLNKSLIITGVLAGAATTIFILVPQLVERIFGAGYFEASQIVKFYAAMMFFFSLTWVVAQYCIATNRLKYVYIIFFFTSMEIALMSLVHGSVLLMVTMLLVVNVVFFFTSYVYAIHQGGEVA